jgi:hypothetical protein
MPLVRACQVGREHSCRRGISYTSIFRMSGCVCTYAGVRPRRKLKRGALAKDERSIGLTRAEDLRAVSQLQPLSRESCEREQRFGAALTTHSKRRPTLNTCRSVLRRSPDALVTNSYPASSCAIRCLTSSSPKNSGWRRITPRHTQSGLGQGASVLLMLIFQPTSTPLFSSFWSL